MTHSQWMAVAVLVVVLFALDILREKRSVPLTKHSGTACFKTSGTRVENHCSRKMTVFSKNSNEAIRFIYGPVCSLHHTESTCTMNHRIMYEKYNKLPEKKQKNNFIFMKSKNLQTNDRVVTSRGTVD